MYNPEPDNIHWPGAKNIPAGAEKMVSENMNSVRVLFKNPEQAEYLGKAQYRFSPFGQIIILYCFQLAK